jgi:pyrroloquinoline quinone biosynthesis protein E
VFRDPKASRRFVAADDALSLPHGHN